MNDLNNNVFAVVLIAVLGSLLIMIPSKIDDGRPSARGWALIVLPYIIGIKIISVPELGYKHGVAVYMLFVVVYSLLIRYFCRTLPPGTVNISELLKAVLVIFFVISIAIYGTYYFLS